MIAPRFKDKKRKISFYLRATTSAGGIHLPPVREEIKDGFLYLHFQWLVFERDLTLHAIQPFAEVRTGERRQSETDAGS